MKPRPATIVLFLLLAAAMLYLNISNPGEDGNIVDWVEHYGWPFRNISIAVHCDASGTLSSTFPIASYFNLFFDLLTCLVIALLPPYVLERLLRRTLQIHLGTAIALLLAAAVLLGLNISIQPALSQFGWPHTFCIIETAGTYWIPAAALGDALIALTLLCAAALITEKLLRKPAPSQPPSTPL